jgi:hypothetical protein
MDAEQDNVSSRALGVQKTGSNGATKSIGDKHKHQQRHRKIERARWAAKIATDSGTLVYGTPFEHEFR